MLALRYDWEGRTVVTVHNLGAGPTVVPLRLERSSDAPGFQLTDLFGRQDLTVSEDGTAEVRLEGYGYRWFRFEQGQP